MRLAFLLCAPVVLLACGGQRAPSVEPPRASVEVPAQDAATPTREPPRRDEPAVVLVVYAEGMSIGRAELFAPNADPEAAVERCRISRGHAVFKAFILDQQIRVRETVERVDLGEGETRCIADALAGVPLRGGMQTDQVIYVRFP